MGGATVWLRVSRGSAYAPIPQIAPNTPVDSARVTPSRAGFRSALRYRPSWSIRNGAVVRVSPSPGSRLRRPSSVSLFVSTGVPRTSVPNVRGSDLADAESRAAAERSSALLPPAFARAELATAEGRQAEIAAANAAFHETIVRLSGSRLLNSMMAPISARVRRLFRLTSDRDPGVLCSEHRELYEAICAGDAELAASLAFVHVERGRRPSLDSLAGVLPAGAAEEQRP